MKCNGTEGDSSVTPVAAMSWISNRCHYYRHVQYLQVRGLRGKLPLHVLRVTIFLNTGTRK